MNTARRSSWVSRWSAAIVAVMAMLVLGACALALWYVDAEGEHLIALQQQEALASELDLLARIQVDEGDAALIRAVNRRARLDGEARTFALVGPDAMLAGNLAAWPVGLEGNERWAMVETPDGRFKGQVATRRLNNGIVALVGEDDNAFRDFRRSIADAVWLAIAAVAAMCLALAAAATNFLLRRVRRLSDVSARVAAGDFSARAPDVDAGGPFGEIAHAMNAMLERIEGLVIGLRTVTDSLAHDLRTPLSQTRRALEAGAAAQTLEAKQAALERGMDHIDRTLATFTALVDIARAEGGLSRDAMETADLKRLAEDVRDLFEPLAEEKNIALQTHFEPMEFKVHRPLLMQAMSNLVQNAIKYAPGGSDISLSLHRIDAGAAFVVADKGPGIPPEQRPDATLRFKRLAGSDQEGSGLGLAIVDACARLHNGTLTLADNSPGLRAELLISGDR